MADQAVDVAIDFGPDRLAIDRALETFCDRYLGGLESPVADAIRYSLMGEGKRLRGILFLRAYEAAGGTADGSAMAGAIVRELMIASGAGGMIGGQLLDLEGEGTPQGLEELQRIHGAKTGALIAAAATIGGLAARTSRERHDALGRYGADIGLAFQIADDVLDVTATTDQLGKTAGRDLALRKSTYPALRGVEGARSRAEALIREGCASLDEVGLLTPALDRIAHFTVERTS